MIPSCGFREQECIYRSTMVSQPEQPDGKSPDVFGGLNAKQERAIVALLREPTVPKAAQAAEVGERTLFRWLSEPVFSKAYRKARRDAFGQAIALTQHYAPHAVNTLVKAMADSSTPAHVRVTAAATLLKFGREGIELDDLAARVEALEQASQAMEGH